MKELNLSFKPKTIDVVLEDDNGVLTKWVIIEMKSSVREEYMNCLNKRTQFNAKGEPVGMKDFKGMHSDLLIRTLFKDGTAVTREQVENWPTTGVQQLYEAAREHNGLGLTLAQKEAEAKKE